MDDDEASIKALIESIDILTNKSTLLRKDSKSQTPIEIADTRKQSFTTPPKKSEPKKAERFEKVIAALQKKMIEFSDIGRETEQEESLSSEVASEITHTKESKGEAIGGLPPRSSPSKGMSSNSETLKPLPPSIPSKP
jgi:hypothetical protein